jgi:biotin transport system substrate-specific component
MEEGRLVLQAALLGAGAAALYDMLRPFRLRFPRCAPWLDGAYVLTAAVAAFAFLLRRGSGELRGFLLCGGVYWLASTLGKRKSWQLWGMALGMLCCYAAGTLWYALGYLRGSSVGVGFVLARCVAPYVIPDAMKLVLAHRLALRLKRFVY